MKLGWVEPWAGEFASASESAVVGGAGGAFAARAAVFAVFAGLAGLAGLAPAFAALAVAVAAQPTATGAAGFVFVAPPEAAVFGVLEIGPDAAAASWSPPPGVVQMIHISALHCVCQAE